MWFALAVFPQELVVTGAGGKMSLGLLGKLKQKKLAAQVHLTADSTLGIVHSTNDAADNKTTPSEKGGASAWGSLKGNLREAQGKGPKGPDIGDIDEGASARQREAHKPGCGLRATSSRQAR
jgi:hypothetical protein